MFQGNLAIAVMVKYWTIVNWGTAGAIMVGLWALFLVDDEDTVPTFMGYGMASFLVLRSYLLWREYRDTKQGF